MLIQFQQKNIQHLREDLITREWILQNWKKALDIKLPDWKNQLNLTFDECIK